ncbi:hypothetical protein OAE64_00895 [bacterium]|nr:hypothetical protein [bacterium]
MKILISLFAVLLLQSTFANSRYVNLFSRTGNDDVETALFDINPTDIVEIVGSGQDTATVWLERTLADRISLSYNPEKRRNWVFTGYNRIRCAARNGVTFKITPVANVAAISKPIILPPTSAGDAKWNVQLQVSTDLTNWEDVVPGEFLGSDKARFFRIKTTTGGVE